MRRLLVLAPLFIAACPSKTPPEAATAYGFQATDGFKFRGGTAISDQHVLTTVDLVPEGVKTARSVYNLAKRHGVEMPISEQVYYVLYEGKSVRQSLDDLLSRDLKRELAY